MARLSILMIAAASLGFLTGCGSVETEVGASAKPEASAKVSVAVAPATLTIDPPMTLQKSAYETAGDRQLGAIQPDEFPGLHNVIKLSDRIVSGSEPHGAEALEKIAEMGVKTILSVDGKVPDVETAEALGMRYVHIPIQYKGITDEESSQIVKTFRELEGPFYVHCFHGKHRGPAAAALGRIAVDGVEREQAIAEMRQWCGTAEKYEGLYRTIAEVHVPTLADTEGLDFDFPAAHPFGGFRQVMVQLPRAFDNLKAFSRNDWKVDPDHPDVDPYNEAAKLLDLFVYGNELHEVAAEPEDFRGWMDDSVREARALKGALEAHRAGSAIDFDAVNQAYNGVANACNACHKVYRND